MSTPGRPWVDPCRPDIKVADTARKINLRVFFTFFGHLVDLRRFEVEKNTKNIASQKKTSNKNVILGYLTFKQIFHKLLHNISIQLMHIKLEQIHNKSYGKALFI